VATAAEDCLSFQQTANKKEAPTARPGLGWDLWCHGGSPVTIRTVTDPRIHDNGTISEIRLV